MRRSCSAWKAPRKEETGSDRNGQHQQSQCSRHDNNSRGAQGKTETLPHPDQSVPLGLAGEARQGGAGQRRHDETLGKLKQPAGIPQGRDTPGLEHRRQRGRDHQTELIDRGTEHDRDEQAANPLDRGVTWPPART